MQQAEDTMEQDTQPNRGCIVHRDGGVSCCSDRTVRVMRDGVALVSLALERVSLFLFYTFGTLLRYPGSSDVLRVVLAMETDNNWNDRLGRMMGNA